MKVTNIKISKIREHEAIDPNHLEKVKKMIFRSGFFKEPIVIDKKTLIVLDGHHRLNSCRKLGLKKIPCLLVNYLKDKKIRVIGRRDNIFVSKNKVIEMGLSGKVFPHKTTKHRIPNRIKSLKIPIKLLL
ncbi:MAG: ParB domain protein nuclease [Candidatus Roizmanbacteria bacterium GW2011_GWA2_35_19]|uniref:ParB domain protein nuclease n=2 Tax=Candidatus Roizmaniibacteriota TaxID=1752723 RepID=A0A0G0C0H0_9BACT|nr:MAG: ParB domain protein nuclease [Candidatus Roizmanbacteria bacterium GW2011_GWC2_35_12]KKP69586.1 MAG: ParB domain protein nuclease [Candidatus Roizmanbacteria bacterium GW2011_GWA2_35_19]